ncbi:hypothetical protein ANRL1_02520 [Anaerolineae bacterium]|nr:hypothetical protein ANRL1_02520 [Anaerolineae bacterium]
MTQDNANQPIVAEEPQASDQNPAIQVDPASEQTTTETQVTEPALEEVEDELAEEEGDSEDATCDETTETESPSQDDLADVAPSSSPTPSAQLTADADADDRCDIQKQPYDFDHCTVQIAIQLLPDDQGHLGDSDANGRMVVVGVRSHLDTPILRLVRLNELGSLPPLVNELLDALKAELPAREQAAREAFEKKKAEKANRKAVVTASKTTTRGRKNKAATLVTSPTSNASVTDNRPRPEVQVTATPQQQMGLF